MNWLPPFVLVTLASSLVLTLVYYYLYRQEQERYLGIWTASWAVQSLRYIFQLWSLLGQPGLALTIAEQLAAFGGGLLLMWGTFSWIRQPVPRWWRLVSVAGGLWICLAALWRAPFQVLTFPVYAFVGAVFIWTGIQILRSPHLAGLGKHLTGWGLLLWGLHKLDYPFVKPLPWLLPWGYLAASGLELVVALGILLAYFQLNREELRRSEERFRLLYERVPTGYQSLDENGSILEVNAAWLAEMGYACADVIGRWFGDFLTPDSRASFPTRFSRFKEQGEVHGVELEMLRKDGSRFLAAFDGKIAWDANGRFKQTHCIFVNVTERRRAEQELQHKSFQQERLLETARHLTGSLDLQQVLHSIAQEATRILESYSCALYLLAEDGRTLNPVVVIDPECADEILAAPIDIDTGFTGRAVKTRRGYIFNEAAADPTGFQVPGTQSDPLERVIVAPFLLGDQVLGAMCLSRQGTLFTPADLSLAETFAAFASIALQNARAHESLQREVEERQRVEEALRLSEGRYRSLFEDSPISLWEEDFSAVKAYLDDLRLSGVQEFAAYFDQNPDRLSECIARTKIINLNRAAVDLYGASSKAELLTDLSIVFEKSSYPCFLPTILAIASGQTRTNYETTNRKLDGTPLLLHMTWTVAPGYEQTYAKVLVSLVDITQRKQAEQALQRKTFQQERLIEVAKHLAESLDVQKVLRLIGAGAREMLEADGCTIYLLDGDGRTLAPVAAIDSNYEAQLLSTPLRVHESLTGQAVLNRKGLLLNGAGSAGLGQQIPGTPVDPDENLLVAPFLVGDRVLGAMSLDKTAQTFTPEDLALAETFAVYASMALKNAQAHDELLAEIEERRRAEDALRISEERFRKAFQTSPDAIGITRLEDGVIIDINRGLTYLTGLEPGDVIGRSTVETGMWANPADREKVMACLEQYGYLENQELQIRHKEGHLVTVLASAALLTLSEKPHVIWMVRSIEERIQAERKLKESETRYRSLFEASQSVMLLIDPGSGAIVDANPAACSYYGCSKSELVAKKITDINALDAEEVHLEMQRAQVEQRNHFLFRHRLANGDLRHVEVYSSPVRLNGDELLHSIVHDITARVQREREMETIVALGTALRGAPSRIEMFPIILDQVCCLLQASGAALVLQDTASGENVFELAVGTAAALSGRRLPPGQGICGRVIESGQPYLNNDVATDPHNLPGDPGHTPPALAAVPLIDKDITIGSLLVGRFAPFDDADQRLLVVIADLVAGAIQRQKLADRALQHARDMAAVSAIGRSLAEMLDPGQIYAHLARAVGELIPDIATLFISRFDPTREIIRAVYGLQDGMAIDVASLPAYPLAPEGQGTQSQVIRTRQPLIVNELPKKLHRKVVVGDGSKETQSALSVPLVAKGEVVGVLQVQSYTPSRFSQLDAELLTIVGNTAASAIQNALLFEETHRRLRRLDALHNIDKAITANADLDHTLRVVLDQVVSQLGVNAADIFVIDGLAQTPVYAAGYGFHSALRQGQPDCIGRHLAGRAALEHQAILISDLKDSIAGLEERSGGDPHLRSVVQIFKNEQFAAYFAVPLVARGQVKGFLELFNRSTLDPDPEWLNFLDTLARQTAIAIDNAGLFSELQRSNQELTLAYDVTLEGWAKALELRDKETKGHSDRVTAWTVRLARLMGFGAEQLVHLRRGALLHDIGKMGIPDSILLKPGSLTEEDWVVMRQHPQFAYELLAPIAFLNPALDIPYCHHERWDGSGYPRGLKGEQIPLAARIFAVIDVWDALLSDRPYRTPWTEEQARRYLQEQSGKQFDPQVVEMFFKTLNGGESLTAFETPPG